MGDRAQTRKPKPSNVRMSAARAAALEESIRKEEKAQGLYLQRLAAADPSLAASLAHEAPSAAGAPPQPPELFETIKAQSLARPDKGSSLDVSRALAQSVNPGFYLRDGAALKSVAKDDFVVDEDELEYMRSQGLLGSEHHRKRNDMSKHVEAAARQRLVVKAAQSAQGAAPAATAKPAAAS